MDGMNLLLIAWHFLRCLLLPRAALAAENLALRQQLAVLLHKQPRPKLCDRDRRYWVRLSSWSSGWRDWLVLVKPETVVRWHRRGFRAFWRRKSPGRPGRPTIPREVIALIRRMARENATRGAPRIRAELHLLGHDVAGSTVAKYLPRGRKPPSQTWKTFLRNHVGCLASVDFAVVPTATFRLLYVFIVLCHERRRVVHFGVTEHPTSAWVARQLTAAFPFDTAPRYLIRDRDGAYGDEVKRCLENLDVEEVLTAPRSPWQNPYVERLIGTLRRELLDHLIVLNERHLMRLLSSFFGYYHDCRSHMALGDNSPNPRAVEGPERGKIISVPKVGGLHHHYRRRAG
jgi:transposase InsO family protein